MSFVNIHAAKTNLSRLIDEVSTGGEVIIARAGKPVARLVPYEPSPKPQKRVLGRLDGQYRVDGFDEPLPDDIQAMLEGRL